MLKDYPVYPTLPSSDLKRTRDFYEGLLGLSVVKETPGGIMLDAGGNSKLYVYKRGPSKADHTLASFMVSDIEKLVDELTRKGIVFEQYNLPGIKPNEKGIAISKDEQEKAAWFKDPDGNILAIGEEL